MCGILCKSVRNSIQISLLQRHHSDMWINCLAVPCQNALLQDMKIEDQVCGLKLAKRLKELGANQNSYFRWEVWHDTQTGRQRKQIVFPGGHTFGDVFSAFTVAELGAMLPLERISPTITKTMEPKNTWAIDFTSHHQDHANTEADARAKMLIYLLENQIP